MSKQRGRHLEQIPGPSPVPDRMLRAISGSISGAPNVGASAG